MSSFYARKDAIDFVNPVKLELNSPFDVRLLFETRDGLLAYNNQRALYNGIVASYKYLSYSKQNADGTIEGGVLNEGKESFIWYEQTAIQQAGIDGTGWTKFRQLENGAIFVMCPFGKPSKPIDGDQYSIHLEPKVDAEGNPVQASGENGLPVWTQYVWVVLDNSIEGTNKYRGVKASDTNWETMTGKWESCGDVYLNIDTSAFPSRAEVEGKLDMGEGWDPNETMKSWTDTHLNVTHKNLEDRIGTFQDFMNGFNNGLGDKVNDFTSDLEISVSFDSGAGVWGSGTDYVDPNTTPSVPENTTPSESEEE